MKYLFKKKVAALFMAVLIVISGCASNSTSSNNKDVSEDDTLKVEVTTAPVGLHPLKTNDAPSTTVSAQIFETLYFRTYEGTEYEPLLAESLPEFSEDGLTATIKLKKGVTFQNGDPFTASCVGYMIDSLKDENYGSLRPSIVESIDSYEIQDDYTIVLDLAYEDGVLVAKLAHTNASIINPELDKSQDLLIDPTGAGTGPYVYVSSTTGSTYSLKANENYWGGKPEIENVVFDVVADGATAVSRLQTGEADLYMSLNADNFATASAIPGYTAVNTPTSSIYYLAFRSHAESAINPLMENIDFRKALIKGIDVKTYVETMLNDTASYSASIVGPTLAGYSEAMEKAGITYDKDEAKSIIDANGWSGETVTLLTSTRDWQQNLAVYIQASLKEIGINVEIVSEEWASFLADAKLADSCDFTILTWSNVTGDGQQMLEPNFSTKNGLRVLYNNAEFDGYVDASAKTTVLEERQAAMLNAVNKIQGDAIVTPLYSANALYVYNSDKFSNVNLDKGQLFYAKDITVVGK